MNPFVSIIDNRAHLDAVLGSGRPFHNFILEEASTWIAK
jgi:hypothetical protein